MQFAFAKMQGLGNDFVVLDALDKPLALTPAQCRHLADRRLGVGCDQILVVEPGRGGAAFSYRIFNADGSTAEQCGNGVRCVARWLQARSLLAAGKTQLASAAGPVSVEILADGQVRVEMGVPHLAPREVPFQADAQTVTYTLDVADRELRLGAVSMGNPHAVIEVDAVTDAPVDTLGPLVEQHPRFPARTNVEFLQIDGPEAATLRVWERGVGETRACGTGACAALVWARLAGRLNETARIELPGGTLVISWAGPETPVWMTGPAEFVFEGRIALN